MTAIKWINVNPREFKTPTVLLVDFGGNSPRYCLVGTDYGYLRNTSGDIRTWKSRSGAYKVRRQYIQART